MISVIIPTYSPKEYLIDCIDSLNKQTLNKDKFEVILILNGEKFPFYNNLRNLLKNTDLNYQLIYTIKPGVSNARNMGLDVAVGNYIAFIDDDDYISPTYLEEMYDIAKMNVMPISNIVAFEDGTNKILSSYMNKPFDKYYGQKKMNKCQLRSFMSVVYCKLIPISIIGKKRFESKYRNGEDSLFMALISNKIDDLNFTSKKAIYYRRCRENSASYKQPLNYLVANNLRLSGEYLKLLASCQYNWLFIFTRILACAKNIIYGFFARFFVY